MQLFSTIVHFYLFYTGTVDMQICALLTTHQCRVTDTRVTVKARVPFVHIYFEYIRYTWLEFYQRFLFYFNSLCWESIGRIYGYSFNNMAFWMGFKKIPTTSKKPQKAYYFSNFHKFPTFGIFRISHMYLRIIHKII